MSLEETIILAGRLGFGRPLGHRAQRSWRTVKASDPFFLRRAGEPTIAVLDFGAADGNGTALRFQGERQVYATACRPRRRLLPSTSPAKGAYLGASGMTRHAKRAGQRAAPTEADKGEKADPSHRANRAGFPSCVRAGGMTTLGDGQAAGELPRGATPCCRERRRFWRLPLWQA